jgi:hypothetical protein
MNLRPEFLKKKEPKCIAPPLWRVPEEHRPRQVPDASLQFRLEVPGLIALSQVNRLPTLAPDCCRYMHRLAVNSSMGRPALQIPSRLSLVECPQNIRSHLGQSPNESCSTIVIPSHKHRRNRPLYCHSPLTTTTSNRGRFAAGLRDGMM